jgi:hypothetical protein
MKSLANHINEASRNRYQIGFGVAQKAIIIIAVDDDYGQFGDGETYKSIDDAVKAIYSVDPICDITIVPHPKFADYMLK